MSNLACFECDTGVYEETFKNYCISDSLGKLWVVYNVIHLVCNKCNNMCLGARSSKQISDALKSQGFPFKDRKPLCRASVKKKRTQD